MGQSVEKIDISSDKDITTFTTYNISSVGLLKFKGNQTQLQKLVSHLQQKNIAVQKLDCSNNLLTSIPDFKQTLVYEIDLSNNCLKIEDLKNFTKEQYVIFKPQYNNLLEYKYTFRYQINDSSFINELNKYFTFYSAVGEIKYIGNEKGLELLVKYINENKIIVIELDISNNNLVRIPVFKDVKINSFNLTNNELDCEKFMTTTYFNSNQRIICKPQKEKKIFVDTLFVNNKTLIENKKQHNYSLLNNVYGINKIIVEKIVQSELDELTNLLRLNQINVNEFTVKYRNTRNISYIKWLPETIKVFDIQFNKLTSLPELPNCVKLVCSGNELTFLPELPNCIDLDCSGNELTFLPELPNCIDLDCCGNELTSLPELPNCVKLHCFENQLSSLPELPNYVELLCDANQLTALPELPNCEKLFCSVNPIKRLPNLPNCIELYCRDCKLTFLPNLPKCIQLDCSDNNLTSIGKINNIIKEIDVSNNPKNSNQKINCEQVRINHPQAKVICDGEENISKMTFKSKFHDTEFNQEEINEIEKINLLKNEFKQFADYLTKNNKLLSMANILGYNIRSEFMSKMDQIVKQNDYEKMAEFLGLNLQDEFDTYINDVLRKNDIEEMNNVLEEDIEYQYNKNNIENLAMKIEQYILEDKLDLNKFLVEVDPQIITDIFNEIRKNYNELPKELNVIKEWFNL